MTHVEAGGLHILELYVMVYKHKSRPSQTS
jgi:hypothetical protein